MIGVWMALTQAYAGTLHRLRLRKPGLKATIEFDHEFLCAVVVHVPQAENERPGSRL